MKLIKILLVWFILLLISLMMTEVQALEKPTTTETIQPVNDTYLDMMEDVFGNESNVSDYSNSMKQFVITIVSPYFDIIGPLLFVFLIGNPFMMVWIAQGHVQVPIVLGIILGIGLFPFLPTGFYLAAISFVALGVTGALFIIYKKRG